MYHYYNAITNTRGDSLPGYYVRAMNSTTNTVASIFADNSGTPINTVSGVSNMALTDVDGNVSFFIENGTYNLEIFSSDQTTLVKRISEVPMFNPQVLGVSAVSALQSAPTTTASVFLSLGERSGYFRWLSGNQSANVASDPLQGIYIPPLSDTSGTSGCWARVWDGVYGKPEWFGAIPNSSGDNCAPAINACSSLAPITLLGAKDYWVSTTVLVNRTGRALTGVSQHYTDGTSETTRILTSSSTLSPIVQLGMNSYPGSRDLMIRGLKLEDVYVGRTVGPDKAAQPVGVLLQYCIGSEISRVKSVDSTYTFRYNGSIACYTRNTNANRVVSGTGTGTDLWVGYWVDGSASIGLAGGNGSVYMSETQAGCNNASLQTGASYGYRMTGKFQDTFMFRSESSDCAIGISIEGGDGVGDADIKIESPIMDTCYLWGIYAANLSAGSTLNIVDPYVGFRSSTVFGMYFNTCSGSINVLGGEVLAGGFSGQPVAIVSSKGVCIKSLQIKECAAIGLATGGTCSSLEIQTVHHNPTVTGSAAVQINGAAATASFIQPKVYGKTNGFGFGIQVVGAIDNRNEYNLTGIDSGCIAGGSGNKLVRNGSQITAAGLTGTNLASGVMT